MSQSDPFGRHHKARPMSDAETERQAAELAASLDAAADELALNGPVSNRQFAELLAELEREWAEEAPDPSLKHRL